MGLAERRAVQIVKDTDYKSFESKVKRICGYDLKLTFDWAALEADPQCVAICERKQYNDRMFDQVTEALERICADEMGKAALREQVKEINLVPAHGELDFSNGIVTILCDLNGMYHDAKEIQTLIEKKL